jgi:hypothetical protein
VDHQNGVTPLRLLTTAWAYALCLTSACTQTAPSTGAKASAEPTTTLTLPANTSRAAATPSASAAAPPISPRFEADLLAIAATYATLTRADGTWWAPEDCRAPIHPAFSSTARSGDHAHKLYTLFVKDYASYAALSGAAPPSPPAFVRHVSDLDAITQVIVKEAWTPVESTAWRERCAGRGMGSFLAEVTMEGKAYRACERAGLFVMYRPATGTESTDDGWVYGTVQFELRPDPHAGQSAYVPRVAAAGRVESCMRCHTKAPHGRLFGLAAGK